MAQYSMNAYDADVYIRQFKGLISNGNDPDGDLMYAVEAENVDTTDGFLQPAADPVDYKGTSANAWTFDERYLSSTTYSSQLLDKLLTWYTGSTARITDDSYNSCFRNIAKMTVNVPASGHIYPTDVYIITSGNGLILKSVGNASIPGTNRENNIIVTGLVKTDGTVDTTYSENWGSDDPDVSDAHWEAVIFQSASIADPFGNDEYLPNAIFVSSPEKGLYAIQIPADMTGGLLGYTCFKVQTPVNFAHIETFGERLWGCGTDDDTLYYSAPYEPTNWQQDNDMPENGAGEIKQPNWDGDHFTGLRKFGDALIAFKQRRAWKITGTDISSLFMTEQFGFGTEFAKTVISSGERMYMANRNGLEYYDGSSVHPMMQDNLRELWSHIRQSAMDSMCAFLYENRKYCLAVPVDSDINNTMIVLDTMDGSVLYYKDMFIRDFISPVSEQNPIVLWNNGKRSMLKTIIFNAWDKDVATNRKTKWVTPWIELGRKDVMKGGYELYFTPEVRGENAVTFTITFQTEKKMKTKTYTAQPMTASEIAAGKQGKTKRLHFGGAGRRFRLIIETPANANLKWRLYGGIHIIAEIDKD